MQGSHEAAAKQRRCTEPQPHGAVDQQMRRRAEAQRRRGLAGGGDVRGRTDGEDVHDRAAGPRGRAEMRRAMPFLADGKMREAARSLWPPRRDPLRRSVSSPASPLFPSLFSFPRSIKPALDFCHSISRPISTLPLFPARFPARPLDFLPARSISHMVPRMAPASSSMASRGRLRTPRRTPCL